MIYYLIEAFNILLYPSFSVFIMCHLKEKILLMRSHKKESRTVDVMPSLTFFTCVSGLCFFYVCQLVSDRSHKIKSYFCANLDMNITGNLMESVNNIAPSLRSVARLRNAQWAVPEVLRSGLFNNLSAQAGLRTRTVSKPSPHGIVYSFSIHLSTLQLPWQLNER